MKWSNARKGLLTFTLVGKDVLMTDMYCVGLCCTNKLNYMDCLTSLRDHAKTKFFHISLVQQGISLIGWIMMPFKKDGHHNILELPYNRKHKKDNPWLIMLSTF